MRHASFVIKVLAAILAVIVTILFINRLTQPRSSYVVNLSEQTVIKQVTSLNRIETASYTIEKIIDVGTTGNKFSQFLYGDRILLIAQGTVIGGFDLGKINEENVEVEGSVLRMKLPAPEVLVAKLDSEQTRVYDRRQGLLTKGDEDLESEARKEAEKVIKDAACQGGILDEASKNARNQLTSLFKSLGFETVIIEIPEGKC
jgi:hypothetical protein